MTVLNDSDISFDESSTTSQGTQGEGVGEFNEQSLNEIAQQMGLSKEQAQ